MNAAIFEALKYRFLPTFNQWLMENREGVEQVHVDYCATTQHPVNFMVFAYEIFCMSYYGMVPSPDRKGELLDYAHLIHELHSSNITGQPLQKPKINAVFAHN